MKTPCECQNFPFKAERIEYCPVHMNSERSPELEIKLYLVGHGYELDISTKEESRVICSDFKATHNIEALTREFYTTLIQAVKDKARIL